VAILDKGVISHIGVPQEMLEIYNAALARKDGQGQEYVRKRGQRDAFGKDIVSSGNQKIEILSVGLWDESGSVEAGAVEVSAVEVGAVSVLRIHMRCHQDIDHPTVGFLIRDRMGYDLFGTNSAEMGYASGSFKQGQRVTFAFRCEINLGPGDYTVTVAAHSHKTHVDECYEWIDRILSFKVLPRSDYHFVGVSFLNPSLHIMCGDHPG
jgi:lipopolysaccharide transport system ATP-binding protein